jgi:hypothetical protein
VPSVFALLHSRRASAGAQPVSESTNQPVHAA